jgi:hypothetical protein
VLILSSSTHVLSIPKGVIWLLVAAIAEIPPVVSRHISSTLHLILRYYLPHRCLSV